MELFATSEVAQLAGLSETQVRALARAGFCRPGRSQGRAYRFSFQDVVLLRAASALIREGLPLRRVNRALCLLREQVPQDEALSALRISVDGNEIVARDGTTVWRPESRQVLLDTETTRAVARIAPLVQRDHQGKAPEETAEAWCGLGLELEAASMEEAKRAYEHALAIDPQHADARVNLGRLLHGSGQTEAAIAQYEIVLEAGEHAIAAYNLGLAHDFAGRPLEAGLAYERALRADPAFAEPHYNLARLADAAGDDVAAVRHLKAYRELVASDHPRR